VEAPEQLPSLPTLKSGSAANSIKALKVIRLQHLLSTDMRQMVRCVKAAWSFLRSTASFSLYETNYVPYLRKYGYT